MRKRQGRRAWRRGTLVLVGIVGFVVAPAGAGSASPQAAAAVEQAGQAEAAGRLEEAVLQLEHAYEVDGDPELLFRLGELTSRLGQDVRALRLYRTYLTRDPGGKNRVAAERRIAALENHAPAASEAAGETLAEPPGAPVGAPTAVSVPVAPAAAAPSPSAAPAFAPPSACMPPPAPAPEPAVGLTTATPSSGPPLPRWLPWAGLAATAGLAIAATISGLSASAQYDQLRTSCGATPAGCSQAQIDDVRSSANRTTVLWVGAGVVAAAAGAGFYVNAREAGFSGVWRF